ncbi:mercuric reductase [Reticulomyxa filosa]|uniref:Mercuric reductase n=1 Tax=Reticulomyxa filosa TaxID=46433 RepID=X6LBL1_RETFI|nr:mercuric reductase [Reticulomyxa filosa]|eukprot:ETN99372.1 mercuric reductase [Reticulomyxa filosa]
MYWSLHGIDCNRWTAVSSAHPVSGHHRILEQSFVVKFDGVAGQNSNDRIRDDLLRNLSRACAVWFARAYSQSKRLNTGKRGFQVVSESTSIRSNERLVALKLSLNVRKEKKWKNSSSTKGIEVNDYLQTSNSNVYAIGDCCTRYQFTHIADAMARMVIRNAIRIDYDVIKVDLGNESSGKFVVIFFLRASVWYCLFLNKKKRVMYSYIERVKEAKSGDKIRTEVNALKMLHHHRHLVRLLEVLDSKQMLYIVLELVECGELFNKISTNTTLCVQFHLGDWT